MQPCRQLKDDMRQIGAEADFERVLAQFLEWRARHDEEIAAGRTAVDPVEMTPRE
jgi:hypothetical protein